MHLPSPALDAAIRALREESNVDAVMTALHNWRLARVIASAPDAHPVIQAVAALFGNVPALLDPPIIADPAFHDAMARIIGTPEGRHALRALATVAPAGWGAVHADALVAAVRKRTCDPESVAALIGPCDASAALLLHTQHIAFAIRRWGQAAPETPIAWFDSLSASERDRLLSTLRIDPYAVARCLPWLPPDSMNQSRVEDAIGWALLAFAEASPTARAQHDEFLRSLVVGAQLADLGALTHLACGMGSKEVWDRVRALVQAYPFVADSVVIVARWEEIAETVRSVILDMTNCYDICAAIAAARGRTVVPRITHKSPTAFFAALDPDVWERLEPDAQRQWLHALWKEYTYLVVRSLGLRPDILARAEMDDNFVHAAKRHIHDAAALRWALLSVALHNIPPDMAHALIAALPTLPPDPGAFFGIASRISNFRRIASTYTALRTPDDLACAVALQRSVDRYALIRARCNGLREALRGRRKDDLAPILTLLDADARAALMPDSDALMARLAYPDRREEMRTTLSMLASLPTEVAVPTVVALHQWITEDTNVKRRDADRDAAEAIAHALHAHGNVFLAIVDALANNDLCNALLPLPTHEALANALRALACDDPLSAHRLAHALCSGDWRAATEIVLRLPTQYRDALIPAPDALVERLAHPDRQDALYQAIKSLPSLPMDDDILTRFALDCLAMYHRNVRNERTAAEDIARALRAHGDVFLSIVDAIADNYLRDTLLPQPEDAVLANTLRDLASDDPLSAHHLGHALYDRNWRAALRVLLTASPSPAAAVWQALDDAVRSEMVAEVGAVTFGIDPIVANNPIIALALAAVQSNDSDLCDAGIDALEVQPDVLRSVWDRLPQETQQFLCTRPAIAVVFADISARALLPTARRRRIC